MNNLYQRVYDEVITLTKAAHMVDEIRQAITAAVLRFHKIDEFEKDQKIVLKEYALPEKVFMMTLRADDFPGFRKFKQIGLEGAKAPLPQLQASDLFTFATRQNGWLPIGREAQVKSSTPFNKLYVVYLSGPNLQPDTFESWVAENHLYAVVEAAAANIFTLRGDTQKASYYATRVEQVHIPEILRSSIEDLDSGILHSRGLD